MSNVKCPRCNFPAEYIPGESEMCPECGAELKPPIKSIGPTDVFSSRNMSDILAEVAAAGNITEVPPADGKSLAERSKALAEMIASGGDIPSPKENPYLEVEFNQNLFFVDGLSSIIRLRLTPKTNLLRRIMLFMETLGADGKMMRREIPVNEIIQTGVPIGVYLSYRPQNVSGRIALDFYIGCALETETLFYKFTVEHKVYDPKQSGSSLAQQIIINQEIKASEAGDVTVRDSIGDAIRGMNIKEPTVHELIDRLNDLPPRFVREELRNTTWRPEMAVVNGIPYPADKLLLEWNGNRIFLLGKKHLKLGRSPEICDLVIRSTDNSLSPTDYPNNTVSRVHAEIIYGGDGVQLFDKSTYGTFIDGLRPDNAGILIPERAVVEFGDIHWQMNMQRCEMRSSRGICQTCRASKIKSMTFARVDGEKEFYLLVWQCCELGRILEPLTDWSVFFRNDSFFIRTPDQEFLYLRPGLVVESERTKIFVRYYPESWT